MSQKQTLTNVEIEKDIIHALKHPPKESETSYQRWTVLYIIIAILLVAIEFAYKS